MSRTRNQNPRTQNTRAQSPRNQNPRTQNTRAQSAHNQKRTLRTRFEIQKPWHFYLLLAFAIFLPFLAETVQRILIGEERVCCMPDNADFLYFRAAVAQFLHPVSNLFIGGSIVASIIIVVRGAVIAKHTLKHKLFLLTVVIFTTYTVCLLVAMLGFFILRNGWYWYGRPWSGGGLYDGAWYLLNHWRIAIFH